MSAMAKACQEEGAQHALEAQNATSAVKVIQVIAGFPSWGKDSSLPHHGGLQN